MKAQQYIYPCLTEGCDAGQRYEGEEGRRDEWGEGGCVGALVLPRLAL